MSQLSTLQDIYSLIAQILDLLSDGLDNSGNSKDLITKINEGVSISESSYTATSIILDNPNNEEDITIAQTTINSTISSLLEFSLANRLPDDSVFLQAGNLPVPIPKSQPIALLPKLIELLLGRNLPLKVILDIILNILTDILKDTIKRKIEKPSPEEILYGTISESTIISIPESARFIRLESSSIPSRISKRFDNYKGKQLINNLIELTPDKSLYTGYGLSSLAFGFSISNNQFSRKAFWESPIKIQWSKHIEKIPDYGFNTGFRYASIFIDEMISISISFI